MHLNKLNFLDINIHKLMLTMFTLLAFIISGIIIINKKVTMTKNIKKHNPKFLFESNSMINSKLFTNNLSDLYLNNLPKNKMNLIANQTIVNATKQLHYLENNLENSNYEKNVLRTKRSANNIDSEKK